MVLHLLLKKLKVNSRILMTLDPLPAPSGQSLCPPTSFLQQPCKAIDSSIIAQLTEEERPDKVLFRLLLSSSVYVGL